MATFRPLRGQAIITGIVKSDGRNFCKNRCYELSEKVETVKCSLGHPMGLLLGHDNLCEVGQSKNK